MLQRMNLHYVIEFDIKGFFDNVNHSKLVRQIWALGIHDKQLIFIIKRILKAPIRMPDGTTLIPDKGTPQGGIISPLLANIVLNELDKWVESQWQNHPLVKEYGYERKIRNSITFDRSKAFLKMRKTGLKEMYIVRYADDFRIFCRNKEDALRTKEAVTAWITERLRLEVSPEKTRIVNVRKRYSEFLGFKIRVRPKSGRYAVQSHICDKKLELERQKLVEQAKRIARPSKGKRPLDEIRLFNSMVLGIQNYFQLATCISIDCRKIHRQVMTVLTNRLNTETGCKLVREGGAMTESEKERFGKSAMVRYVSGIDQPIYMVENWKRFRKWGGIPTGMTQNAKDLLASREIENILENSDFVYMLSQSDGDRAILAQKLGLSDSQLEYVKNVPPGEGIMFFGDKVIPFRDRYPKDTMLYRLMTTKPNEVIQNGVNDS